MYKDTWDFRLLICVVGLLLIGQACAAEQVEVLKSEGDVTVHDKLDGKRKAVTTKSVLPSSGVLATGANGRAVVQVGETGIIVLEKNSSVELNRPNEKAGFFQQLFGAVYYAVNSLKGKDRTLEVRTKTATMGIRGTRFIVTDVPERNEVGMRKGELSVVSPKDEFEIHKKAEMDEFEVMKREGDMAMNKAKSDFEAYKADTQREFIEYKREFTLGVNRMVSFDGKRVDDRPLSGETKKDMETLESYAAAWLDQIHD